MTNSVDPDQLASDLDLHCLQRQDISGFSRTRVKPMSTIIALHISIGTPYILTILVLKFEIHVVHSTTS